MASITLLIFFGLIPSIIWLLFYLRKDVHPESKRMIIKIFLYGMIAALPAIFIEIWVLKGLEKLNLSLTLFSILNWFVGIALVEETLKYLVVKGKVLSNPEFDEPTDAMIYMIVAALGFAASENLLALWSQQNYLLTSWAEQSHYLDTTAVQLSLLKLSILRFLGATLLHALCSGTLGFFLALSLFKNKLRILIVGFGIAIFLHGLYDYSIIETEGTAQLLSLGLVVAGLVILAILVSLSFKRLKEIKSICHTR